MSLSRDEILIAADQLLNSEHYHDRFRQLVNVACAHMSSRTNDRFFKLMGLHAKAQGLAGGVDTLSNMEHHYDETTQLFLRRYISQWMSMTTQELMFLYLGAAESYNMVNSGCGHLRPQDKMKAMYQSRVWIDLMYTVLLFPNQQLVLQNKVSDDGPLDIVDSDVQQREAKRKMI